MVVAHSAASAAHAFFFIGNCQLQFFARPVARILSALVFCLGRVQIPHDGTTKGIAELGNLIAEARRLREAGQQSVLILQESLIGKGSADLDPEQLAAFDRIVRVPIFHFRSIWPDFHLSGPSTFTPRTVRRMFEREQEKIDETVARCGGAGFDREDYWRLALGTPAFFHPGHANEKIHGLIYDAFLRTPIAELAGQDKADGIAAAVSTSLGVPITSLHPIKPVWGDAVGTQWHDDPAYRRWSAFAAEGSRRGDAIACVEEVAQAFGPALGALCADDLSRRVFEVGRFHESARLAAYAAGILPGTWNVLGNALATNAKLDKAKVVKSCLRSAAPHLEPGSALHENTSQWLKRNPRFAPVEPARA